MRRITSFKPQYRQTVARSATPPPPSYEPLSPELRPTASVAANPADDYGDGSALHRRYSNGAGANFYAVTGNFRALEQHGLPAATYDYPPQCAAPLPPPHPLPSNSWAPGSPIEAFADVTVTSQRTSPIYIDYTRRASYAATSPTSLPHPIGECAPKHAYSRDPVYPYDERPAKRARSEFYGASSPTYGQQHSRPATSHNPGWSYNVEHMADMGTRMYQDNGADMPKQEHNPDKRLSDAQLLLDFFQVSAHTAQTPPSTAKRLSISQIPPAYPTQYPSQHSPLHTNHSAGPISPHAVVSQHPIHHAQHPHSSSDGAHAPEPPSLPTDVALPAPAVQTRTPPEDISTIRPPPPVSNVASTEEIKPKKHQGWPKGKPRGPRNTPSSSKRKKATPKPKAASSTSAKSAVDHLQPLQKNGSTAVTTPISSSATVTPPSDQPSDVRRHSFSNSFLVLPNTDLPSEAVRAQSVPLQAFLGTAPPTVERTQRTKAQQAVEPDLICASCKSSDSEVKVGDGEQWIGCDGCKEWYHYACAGFNSEREVRDVNKFYCEPCRPKFGQTTSRSTDAYWSTKSDLAQRFVNLSEPTLPLITPA